MTFADEPQTWVDQLRPSLPAHVNIAALTGTSDFMNLPLAVVALWTDYPYERCPKCRQQVPRTGPCPLALDGGNPSNPIEGVDLLHQCGHWLETDYETIAYTEATGENVRETARRLAHAWAHQVHVRQLRRRRNLRQALAERAQNDPQQDGESIQDYRDRISAESELFPGLYWDDQCGTWAAWDYDPGDEEQILVEHLQA